MTLDPAICYEALKSRDRRFEGRFVVAVRTTGIFCRPGCPARTPRRDHVRFFATAREALFSGLRPCKRCRPLEAARAAPAWAGSLVRAVDREPARRWRDRDLRALGLDPVRVRRWFTKEHGMTFQAYARARRLGTAFRALKGG